MKQRKVKLVATSPKNGRLPNNIIKVAPNAKKLAGRPFSYFLGTEAASAPFETSAHAGATYETRAHAEATYETKAAAAASRDQVFLIPGESWTAPGPGQRVGVMARNLTLPRAGRVHLSTAFQVRTSCAAASDVAAWITVDDAVVPGTLFVFPPSTTSYTTAVLNGVTAASLSPGQHVVVLWTGCLSANLPMAGNYNPSGIQAILLGTQP